MSSETQAVPRHLIFVLDDGHIVIQRGASQVEVLGTRERRAFNSSDRAHDVSNAELQGLVDAGSILEFDDNTVWLPAKKEAATLRYYFLDTRLPPPYLGLVENLLKVSGLEGQYVVVNRLGRVAVMGKGGEPFSSLTNVEAALTLVKTALGDHMIDISVESIEVTARIGGEQPAKTKEEKNSVLIRQTPASSLTDRIALVIESDSQQLEMIQGSLEPLGIQLRRAFTGKTAMEILQDEEPDIVLINLQLPDMHGYQVIAKIKRDSLMGNTPIIVMSPHESETDVAFALQVAQVDAYLRLPCNPNELRNRTLSLLRVVS